MSKKAKTYRLSNEVIEIIQNDARTCNISETAALEKIILAYNTSGANSLSSQIADEIEQRFYNWKTGVLLSSRQAERYGFQIIEMINSLSQNLLANTAEVYFPTYRLDNLRDKLNKDESYIKARELNVSEAFKNSERVTQEYYAYLKQRKDNKPEK